VTSTLACAQDMQPADTIGQRLDRLFKQQDYVTIDDLLAVVQSPDELHSNAFRWAVHKLIWRLDSSSQAYRDLKDFKQGVGRFGFVPNTALKFCMVCSCTVGFAATGAVLFVLKFAAAHGLQGRERQPREGSQTGLTTVQCQPARGAC
jgi:hypothetical protein